MPYWILKNIPPDPARADADGLVALGGSLQPSFLLSAYRAGCFPWSSKPVLNWWSPDPRMVFELDSFTPSKSLQKSIRRSQWRFAIDTNFDAVIRACANTRPDTWITADIIAAYTELHRLGHAHSIEVYEQSVLVGGLYGVSIGGFFGGESMFHHKTDASKAAVAYLIEHLRSRGMALLDAQAPTPHLASLGAVEIPRAVYLNRLRDALQLQASFTG